MHDVPHWMVITVDQDPLMPLLNALCRAFGGFDRQLLKLDTNTLPFLLMGRAREGNSTEQLPCFTNRRAWHQQTCSLSEDGRLER